MLRTLIKRCLNVALLCAAIAVGLVVAELLLSVVLRSETDFLSHLRPGPYCEDAYVGISSACAGRRVNMRVLAGTPRQGTEQFAHYKLNQDGYRGPFTGGRAADRRKPIDVVFVGGASQGFGFGVDDEESFPAVAARHTCVPTRVHNFAYVGLGTPATWHYFQQRHSKKTEESFIFITIYYRIGYSASYTNMIKSYLIYARDVILFNKWLHAPRSIRSKASAKTFLQVYLVHRYDEFNKGIELYNKQFYAYWERIGRVIGIRGVRAAEKRHSKTPPLRDGNPKHMVLLRDFLRDVDSYAKAKGARMGVLLLPHFRPNPRLTDEHIKAALPADAMLIDTNSAVKKKGLYMERLKDGHFSPIQTEVIGRTIAESLNRVLDCPNPGQQGRADTAPPTVR